MKRLIYAEDAMQNVLDEIRYKESLYTSTAWHIAKKAIDAAPTIEPKRIKAEWVYAGEDVCNTYRMSATLITNALCANLFLHLVIILSIARNAAQGW